MRCHTSTEDLRTSPKWVLLLQQKMGNTATTTVFQHDSNMMVHEANTMAGKCSW